MKWLAAFFVFATLTAYADDQWGGPYLYVPGPRGAESPVPLNDSLGGWIGPSPVPQQEPGAAAPQPEQQQQPAQAAPAQPYVMPTSISCDCHCPDTSASTPNALPSPNSPSQ